MSRGKGVRSKKSGKGTRSKDKKFTKCKYCNSSVKTANYYKHLKEVHLAELPEDEKEFIRTLEFHEDMVEDIDKRSAGAASVSDLKITGHLKKDIKWIEKYGTASQKKLSEWFVATNRRFSQKLYYDADDPDSHAMYLLTDMFLRFIRLIDLRDIDDVDNPRLHDLFVIGVEEFVSDLKNDLKDFDFAAQDQYDLRVLIGTVEMGNYALKIAQETPIPDMMERITVYLGED